jgi:hypothetical protein
VINYSQEVAFSTRTLLLAQYKRALLVHLLYILFTNELFLFFRLFQLIYESNDDLNI